MNTPLETLPANPSTCANQPGLPGCHTKLSADKQVLNHVTSIPVPVDPDTEAELAEHEATIADSLTNAFVRAGNALQIILDKKLYKNQFESFDAYVQHRWGWQRAHAYRLIQAAQIVGGLSPIGDTLPMPTSESQLRPLSRLGSEKRRLVWMKAVQDAGGRTPTADIVKAAVTVVMGPRKKPTATVAVDPAEDNLTGTPNCRPPAEHRHLNLSSRQRFYPPTLITKPPAKSSLTSLFIRHSFHLCSRRLSGSKVLAALVRPVQRQIALRRR